MAAAAFTVGVGGVNVLDLMKSTKIAFFVKIILYSRLRLIYPRVIETVKDCAD